MKRPTKKEIKDAVDKLKDSKADTSRLDQGVPKLEAAKNSKRIRKQGI